MSVQTPPKKSESNFWQHRQHNDENLGVLIRRLVESYGLKDRLAEVRLRQLWLELIGQGLDAYTRSIQLKEGKLYIRIESASLRQELSYAKEKIQRFMNEGLGENRIQEVIIS